MGYAIDLVDQVHYCMTCRDIERSYCRHDVARHDTQHVCHVQRYTVDYMIAMFTVVCNTVLTMPSVYTVPGTLVSSWLCYA